MKNVLFSLLFTSSTVLSQTRINKDTTWLERNKDTLTIHRFERYSTKIGNQGFIDGWKGCWWVYLIKGDSLVLIDRNCVMTK